jgi:hypothetical protein
MHPFAATMRPFSPARRRVAHPDGATDRSTDAVGGRSEGVRRRERSRRVEAVAAIGQRIAQIQGRIA